MAIYLDRLSLSSQGKQQFTAASANRVIKMICSRILGWNYSGNICTKAIHCHALPQTCLQDCRGWEVQGAGKRERREAKEKTGRAEKVDQGRCFFLSVEGMPCLYPLPKGPVHAKGLSSQRETRVTTWFKKKKRGILFIYQVYILNSFLFIEGEIMDSVVQDREMGNQSLGDKADKGKSPE